MSNENFDRQYRFSAGKSGSTGFEIDGLHISFSIEKSEKEAQNTGKVTIWNLNKTHLSALNEKDCSVVLKAGYRNRLSVIFSGIVSFVSTTQADGDVQTEIEVVDNLVQIRDTFVSLSYNGTVNWKAIFDDTAAQMGVVVSYSFNAEFTEVANGFSFVGKAIDIISKGCACCGLSHSIQNGVLQIKKTNDVMSREVYLLSAETGLIGTPAKVLMAEDQTGGNKSTVGWDVEYLLNGAIQVDDYVRLDSKYVSGYFRVYSVQIDGDNMSGDWVCKARLLELQDSGSSTSGS